MRYVREPTDTVGKRLMVKGSTETGLAREKTVAEELLVVPKSAREDGAVLHESAVDEASSTPADEEIGQK